MKLSEFLNRVKLQTPNLDNVSDDYIKTVLNQAVDQVNILAKVYATYTDFDIEADKRIYSLSSIVPTFLGTDKRGLYVLNSDDQWILVYPKTESWLRSRYDNYLNASSITIPTWYWTEGDNLGFYPPMDTSITLGGRLYHLKKSADMSENDDYPWVGTTTGEITAFLPLDDAIIAYARWKLSPQFGSVTDQDLRYKEYLLEIKKGAKAVKRRQDLTNDPRYYIKTW